MTKIILFSLLAFFTTSFASSDAKAILSAGTASKAEMSQLKAKLQRTEEELKEVRTKYDALKNHPSPIKR